MENTYFIRIPVLMTKPSEEKFSLFNISYEEMTNSVCLCVKNRNVSKSNKIIIESYSKTYKQEVVSLKSFSRTIGETPCVLLQISAHKTNLNDGYIEIDNISNHESEKFSMTKNTKIGSDNHFALLYPNIIKQQDHYKFFWNVFVYDDPYKDTDDLLRVVKHVLKNVLNLKTANMKRKDFVEELRSYKAVPEMIATFNTMTMHNGPTDAYFSNHVISTKIQSKKEIKLHNMPFEDVETLVLKDDRDNSVQRKIFKLFLGKKEIKVSKTLKKDLQIGKEKYHLLIESLFNESIEISEDDIVKMYNKEFVLDKISKIVPLYIS